MSFPSFSHCLANQYILFPLLCVKFIIINHHMPHSWLLPLLSSTHDMCPCLLSSSPCLSRFFFALLLYGLHYVLIPSSCLFVALLLPDDTLKNFSTLSLYNFSYIHLFFQIHSLPFPYKPSLGTVRNFFSPGFYHFLSTINVRNCFSPNSKLTLNITIRCCLATHYAAIILQLRISLKSRLIGPLVFIYLPSYSVIYNFSKEGICHCHHYFFSQSPLPSALLYFSLSKHNFPIYLHSLFSLHENSHSNLLLSLPSLFSWCTLPPFLSFSLEELSFSTFPHPFVMRKSLEHLQLFPKSYPYPFLSDFLSLPVHY